MKLTDRTVTELLAAIRAPEPAPGGGSASALAGALGASLLAMVAGLPKSRATTEQDVERLQVARARSGEVAETLRDLIDRDSEAYAHVVDAYRLPKSSEDEKQARSAAIQAALGAAIDTPMDVMRGCVRAVEQSFVIAQLGNRNASSDVLVALELLGAGVRGAKLNVEINLDSAKDHIYAQAVRDESEQLNADFNRIADAAQRYISDKKLEARS
jgi:formiminotetrahydrofolate cyclodeaminase